MRPSPSLCFSFASLMLAPVFATAAPSVSLVSGTNDPVKVQTAGKHKPDGYFRVSPGGEKLVVAATGPTTLSIRFRATGPGKLGGLLRILRDDGPFSDNNYELAQDDAASSDFNAAIEKNAVSVERVLHVPVADGEHHYELSAVKGPPLLVRVFKTSKFDRALAAAPEKNTSVDTAPAKPPPAKEQVTEKETPAPAQQPEQPAERPPPTLETHQVAPPEASPSELPEQPATTEVLPEKPLAPANPQTHSGMAIGVRTGVTAFLGFRNNQAVSTGPIGLSNRLWHFTPFDVDVSWDITGTWSLFLEGSSVWGTRKFSTYVQGFKSGEGPVSKDISVESNYRVVPLLVGVTAFAPAGRWVGFRFRLGLGTAFASAMTSPTDAEGLLPRGTFQSTWTIAGTVGVSFEVRAGPGRFTIEARYLAVPMTWFGAQTPVNGINALPPDLGGLQFLGGYRVELF